MRLQCLVKNGPNAATAARSPGAIGIAGGGTPADNLAAVSLASAPVAAAGPPTSRVLPRARTPRGSPLPNAPTRNSDARLQH